MPLDSDSFFRALSDATRRRCLMLLVAQGELCVCELTHALGLPQPKISHHLAALRRAGLVSDQKQGLWVYYRLSADLPPWCREVLQATAQGLRALPPYCDDATTLSGMPNRPGACCVA